MMDWLDWDRARYLIYPLVVLFFLVTGFVVLRRMGNRPDPLNRYNEGEDPRSREIAGQLAAKQQQKHNGASTAVKGAGGFAATRDDE